MGLDQTIAGVLSRFRPRAVVVAYLVLQGLAVAGWWVMLVVWPGSRAWFFPDELTDAPLMSFWLADLGLLTVGSLVAAWLVWRGIRAGAFALWFLAGAWYHPALYCLVLSHNLGGGELGIASMFAAGGLTLAMATVVGGLDAEPAGFRPCRDPLAWAGCKSLLQIVVFWVTFLYVLPYCFVGLQAGFGIALFEFAGRWVLGGVVFALFGALGLWSAWCTLVIGRGTPLPTDCASVLVVSGPYRYVRNPMALAGIGQGVTAGVLWGSWPVMLYALFGGLVWHFGARPVEEIDLARRFGDAYERYRASVRCWLPRRP